MDNPPLPKKIVASVFSFSTDLTKLTIYVAASSAAIATGKALNTPAISFVGLAFFGASVFHLISFVRNSSDQNKADFIAAYPINRMLNLYHRLPYCWLKQKFYSYLIHLKEQTKGFRDFKNAPDMPMEYVHFFLKIALIEHYLHLLPIALFSQIERLEEFETLFMKEAYQHLSCLVKYQLKQDNLDNNYHIQFYENKKKTLQHYLAEQNFDRFVQVLNVNFNLYVYQNNRFLVDES